MPRITFTHDELGRTIQILDALLVNHTALESMNPRHRVDFHKLRRKLTKAKRYSRVGLEKLLKMKEKLAEKEVPT